LPIETLDELRAEFKGLLDQKYVQSNGSIERRGIEVDHNWYQEREGKTLGFEDTADEEPATAAKESTPSPVTQTVTPDLSGFTSVIEQLQQDNLSLRHEIDTLTQSLEELKQQLIELKQELGS
ncbi:MAG TPA: hypothetical protein DCM07_01365, partial [Planctomycetaceae bacterium]|nr:hypothetical protein [Planctomycetaceae bacterium]